MSVPSAFTAATGRCHWDTLLRARAIENLSYVVAAGQAGRHENGRETWGHSLIVGPWGDTLAELANGTGVVTAVVEPARLSALRRRFPALEHRRIGWDGELDVYTGDAD